MIHLKKVANQTSSSAARLRLRLPRLLHVGHGLCQLHIRLLLALQGTIRQGADGALPGTVGQTVCLWNDHHLFGQPFLGDMLQLVLYNIVDIYIL
jgi:hypothetical protein